MSIVPALPNTLQNGQPADANQVMANFNTIRDGVNSNAAANGANDDITSLSGLTTPLSVPQGGTGAASFTAGNLLVGSGASPIADSGVSPTVLMPTAAVLPYAGSSAPTGWLLCYGQAVSRTTYSALFAAIGTTYGAGDGSTTFNLPDMRGRVAAGVDNMGGTAANRLGSGNTGGVTGSATLGAAGGEQSHTTTTAEMPVHAHGVSDPGHAHTLKRDISQGSAADTIDVPNLGVGNSYPIANATETATTGITIQNAGSGGAHNNVQPTLVLNYIIKT